MNSMFATRVTTSSRMMFHGIWNLFSCCTTRMMPVVKNIVSSSVLYIIQNFKVRCRTTTGRWQGFKLQVQDQPPREGIKV